jgi:hypothetical protein
MVAKCKRGERLCAVVCNQFQQDHWSHSSTQVDHEATSIFCRTVTTKHVSHEYVCIASAECF